ncbi:MAG TPA: helix-turn-helix transcriptional regulator [Thermodesulfobacteriota bacterium]
MATTKYDTFRAELLAHPETRAAYDALEPKYGLLRALVAAREAAGVTQAEMARRMGTSRSALSRLESAAGPSPNWETVTRYAREAGYEIEVRLRPAAKRGRTITARIPARPVGRGGAAAKTRSRSTGARARGGLSVHG